MDLRADNAQQLIHRPPPGGDDWERPQMGSGSCFGFGDVLIVNGVLSTATTPHAGTANDVCTTTSTSGAVKCRSSLTLKNGTLYI